MFSPLEISNTLNIQNSLWYTHPSLTRLQILHRWHPEPALLIQLKSVPTNFMQVDYIYIFVSFTNYKTAIYACSFHRNHSHTIWNVQVTGLPRQMTGPWIMKAKLFTNYKWLCKYNKQHSVHKMHKTTWYYVAGCVSSHMPEILLFKSVHLTFWMETALQTERSTISLECSFIIHPTFYLSFVMNVQWQIVDSLWLNAEHHFFLCFSFI
jgi:hypothetical protein